MLSFTEDTFEQAIIELFENMGYTHIYAPDMNRTDYSRPLLDDVLRDCLVRLNRSLPAVAIDEAILKLNDFDAGSLLRKNIIFMDYLQNGITVKYAVKGEERSSVVKLIDYADADKNDFYVVNQYAFVENGNNRRPDIILFVNGLPLVLMELKSPSKDEVGAENAYNQIRNYMKDIPSMFYYNAICVISDLSTNKAGTITSGLDRFMEWKTKDGDYENTAYAQFDTFYEGMFQKERLLDILKNFILFSGDGQKPIKILAGYHQYFAVRKAIEKAKIATKTDGKGGVFWHTQGSGKSLSMVFYIDIYDMTQAVEDGATRPVYYESRVIKLHLDQNTLALIDATYDALEQQSDAATIEKSKKMLGQMESVLGADSTIQSLCEDIVDHYEKYRANLLTGKAMIVAYSRPIAMKIYRKLLELRPTWNEKIGVVMTGGNNDPEDWKEIIGTKSHKEELARKFKDNDDPMKIAIVVDMWLTGFDVPSLATMYVYKPMHGYNLMQAIARVNRVFKDKEGGLIVDYVGIASALKAAMKEYTKRDQSRYGDMDIAKVAYPKFQEKLQVCKDLLHGFDFSGFIGGSPLMMAKLVTGGVNFVLDAKAPKRKDLFLREALLLKQSHSLCSSMTTEQERHEAAYMEAVRSTVVKITYGGSGGKTLSLKEINAQINELLKASIQSQGVISLFDSKQADENISLFDPAVLDEISKMKEKNIAVEILKKLMAEQVSLYKRTNVVQSQKFSEKIAQLMNSYYNGLITNEEVIKELLKTAQEITELYNNGEKLGLTQEELAFYDALTKPENIKDFYQNNELIDLTRELTEMLRKNRTIDWQKKETARASMRKMVKHLLKKYKYPPEDYDTAISTVISQCEMWTDNMTA
ncbi:type I restriction endonuclease subunit R [Clostridium fessum]|jgi:type I site-specific restriction-modification system R (restriction) subunit|uniref:type I restriction endonuclease subunit R n=1 Tax=Clostridium fessum TaxID=2126740 RepID=UPI003AF192F2